MANGFFSAFKSWVSGYTKEHILAGIQSFICVIVIGAIIFPPAIYHALSYEGRLATVSLVFTSLLLFSHYTGNGVYMALSVTFGVLIGCILNLCITAITFGINGCSMENTATKFVIFILFMSITMGTVNVIRWYNESLNMLFFISTIGVVLSGVLYRIQDTTEVHWVAPFYSLAQVAIASSGYVICIHIFFPVTTGSKYRMLLRCSMHNAAAAIDLTKKMILSPLNSATGAPMKASGVVDASTGWDTGLYDSIAEIRSHVLASRSSISATRPFNLETQLEIDVYNTPRIFPQEFFRHAKFALWNSVRCIALLVRQLQAGHEDLSFLQHDMLKQPLSDTLQGMTNLLEALGDSLIEPYSGNSDDMSTNAFKKADAIIRELDVSWQRYTNGIMDIVRIHPHTVENEKQRFGLLNVSGGIYFVGIRLRRLYAAVASALRSRNKEAEDLAALYFEEHPMWMRASEALALASAANGIDAAESNATRSCIIQLQQIAEESSKPVILPASKWNAPRAGFPLFKLSFDYISKYSIKKVHHVPLWALLFIQMAVAIAIATSLASIPVIVDVVFNGNGVALLTTTLALYMPSLGLLEMRAVYRCVGTLMGIVMSYFIVGVTYAVNGLSWDETATKIIVTVLLTALWVAFLTATQLRYLEHTYAFIVSAFTVPLLVMPSMYSTSPPWKPVAYRMVETLVGMAIVVLCSMLFPILVYDQVKGNFCVILEQLSELVGIIPNHLSSFEGDPRKLKRIHKPDIETFHTFYSAEYAKPFALALAIDIRLNKLRGMMPALHAEYNILSKFKWTRFADSSVIANSCEALQACASFSMLAYDLKIEHNPEGPMPVQEWLYNHILNITELITECLLCLKGCIHGKKSISDGMKSIDALDAALKNQLKDIMANSEHRISVPIMLLLYVGLGFSQQVRILWKVCSRGLLFKYTDDELRMIDKKAEEQSALGPDIWIENVLALALD